MSDKFQVKRNLENIFDDAVCNEQSSGELYQQLKITTDRYAHQTELGQGAMKTVSLVKDKLTGRLVAKATLKGDTGRETSERFLREARICARLEHPNIVPLHDLGIDENDEVYFTMKLVEGISFQELIEEIKINQSDLSLSELLDIFVKICDAVSYAHSQGIIHLDLKPENIQISHFGEVMVCDWGLARDINQQDNHTEELIISESFVTQDGVIRGTPGYMSPEQARGSISESSFQSDIYSLGAILYTILSLERPGKGSVKEVLAQTVKGDFPSPSQVSPKREIPAVLEAISCKAMELNPNERYTSVAQLKSDLLSYLRGFVTSVEKSSFLIQVKLLVKRNKLLSFVMIISGILLISATSIFLISIKKSESEAKIAAKQARDAELEAKDNLTKWQRTNELKRLIASESMPQLISLTRNAVENYEVQKGIDLAKVAVELDQSLQIAHRDLGYLQASLFEFEASIQSYQQGGMGDKDRHILASQDCLNKFKGRKDLSFEEIIWIVRTFDKYRLHNMINEFTFSPKLHFLTLDQRRLYALEVLKLQNHNLKEVSFEGHLIKMDSSKIVEINGLYRTNITELDLRHAELPRNIASIRGLPLKTITLPEHEPNRQIPYLKTCKTLERVYLPEKTTDKDLLKDLPKSIKVIFY
ncbi:serine/threonine-protein kinase [Lentisphaera marina]|uniref:serine/threonine protein kinase n=1 Tax=Lentisphaera marina TaxID=1111041 RepID=UPI0023659BBA|nr:serine/threonine-protein kinase [Lentisphaera marina]MDD7984413.1 serine/threonine-protein kinase [Lentisphaera marina]